MPTEHFKSKAAYRKWNAYRHIHGIPAPNLKTAVIAGKPHTVKHSELSKPKEKSSHLPKQHEDMKKFKGVSTTYDHKRPKRQILTRYSR